MILTISGPRRGGPLDPQMYDFLQFCVKTRGFLYFFSKFCAKARVLRGILKKNKEKLEFLTKNCTIDQSGPWAQDPWVQTGNHEIVKTI